MQLESPNLIKKILDFRRQNQFELQDEGFHLPQYLKIQELVPENSMEKVPADVNAEAQCSRSNPKTSTNHLDQRQVLQVHILIWIATKKETPKRSLVNRL